MIRVLFVDDEPAVLDGLRRQLHGQRHEWEMTFVTSGAEALAALAAGPFDAIVADVQMPGMHGLELLTQVQQRFPTVARVVLSGHVEPRAALQLARVAHRFLSKPCDGGLLRETITRLCGLQAHLADEGLRALVSELPALPTAPRTSLALAGVLADEDRPLREIAAIVAGDVGLAAKMLQIVNSAFFALPRPVVNVEQAVSLLGANTVRGLVTSLEVLAGFPSVARDLLDDVQRHALLTAAIARRLLADRARSEEAFTAALLHDTGRLVLATRRPSPAAAEAAEVSHAEVGAYLLGIWGLPFAVVEAVAHHHRPDRLPQSTFDVAGAVHVANALAVDPVDAAALDRGYLERVGMLHALAGWLAAARREAEALRVKA